MSETTPETDDLGPLCAMTEEMLLEPDVDTVENDPFESNGRDVPLEGTGAPVVEEGDWIEKIHRDLREVEADRNAAEEALSILGKKN